MTESSAPNLSRAGIHRLLAAVGSAPTTVDEMPAATLYDWRDPHYFDDEQGNRLAALMNQSAALLAERFVHFYNGQFDVRPASIDQHFAEDLSRQIDPDRSLSLSFGPDPDHPCGFLAVATEVALDWVTGLLGDAEANNDPDRAISSLEESLLSDLLFALGEAFLHFLGGAEHWRLGDNLLKGIPGMPCDPTEALCRITFQIQKAEEASTEMSFVLPASSLAPIVGKSLPSGPPPTQEQLAPLLMEHLQEMPVTVTARLAATRLRFEEILDLEPDDILLIDKPIAEPLDVIIDNGIVFRGRPAQSAGQYAVFVT
jgi:flagellar motor switch protein FliM